MQTPSLHQLRGLVLGLGLFLSITSHATAAVAPMPPILGWTTDGVGAPDSSPWPTNAIPQILGVWPFPSPTNLSGFRADPPILASNLFLVPSPWGTALRLASDLPACLRFGVRQSNTNGDFSVRNGTVSLWLRPDWSVGGPTAPASTTPLVEAGTLGAARSGWWGWVVSAGGGEMQFLGQARGQQATWLRTPVGFTSNRWMHLALTWTPTNSSLFVNGLMVTNGTGVTHWPALAERESVGWGVGGDRSGQLRIRGDLDTLFTANHPLSPDEIRQQFNVGVASQTDPTAAPSASQSSGILVEFDAPSRPSSFRPGLWIEGALGVGTGAAGGWLHGTVVGIMYEIFAARTPIGPWLLDQQLPGASGQTWTSFTLQSPPPLPWFTMAAPFTDTDQDGLSDEYEKRVSQTNLSSADTDGDGMPDGWEMQNGLNPQKEDGLADKDSDGYFNVAEYMYDLDPSVANPRPEISVRASTVNIAEGSTGAKFILKRSGSTAQPLEVDIEFTGPSVNGYDYTELPGRVTIAAGRAEVELPVTPLLDGRDEKDESVILTVKRGAFYDLDTVRTAQMVIQDRDLPSVAIRATDPDASEPEYGRTNPGEFEVRRSGLTELPLLVGLRLAAANTAVEKTDVQPIPTSITIPAGEIRARVPVIPLNNRKLTGQKLLKVEIVPATTAYTIESAQGTATVTIAEIEPPVVTVIADDSTAEEKALAIGRFKFIRAGGSTRPLTVLYHVGGSAQSGDKDYTTHPADYEALSGSVTIPAGSNEAWVDVKPIADPYLETLETVQVTIAGSLDYLIGDANTATVFIDDSNPSQWRSELIQPTSVAGQDGPEGLIAVTRFGTVMADMPIPYKVTGQRILKPSGQVLPFGDPKLATQGASYLLSVNGVRVTSAGPSLVIPKGAFQMRVGIKATLPSEEVKGATLILAPGTATQQSHEVPFLDRWSLVSIQSTAEHVVEGGQIAIKVTAAATDPKFIVGTTVRFTLSGTANPETDVTISGASASGIDDTGHRFVDVTIAAKPPTGTTVRSATLTIKATADNRVEKTPNLLVFQYRQDQMASALSSAQQSRPYAPLQIRDSTAIALPPLDCDQDGFPDSFEVDHDMDPLTPSISIQDEDSDGILDLAELKDRTRYDSKDTDGDGISDFIEKLLGIDPLVANPTMASHIRDMVPVRLRTSGLLREKVGECYQCHAPGMSFGGIEMMDVAQGGTSASVMLARDLLLAPGSSHEITLTTPPAFKGNSAKFSTYSAEVLPAHADKPSGFVIVEGNPLKPLLGRDLPIESDTFTTRKATLRVLKKPMLAVDTDRDGVIRFDASDATSDERPYRFWVNNDNDISAGAVDPEGFDPAVQDHADGVIKNIRDLEDFSRLWLDLQGLQSIPSSAKLELAFEWRNVTEGTPAIQIYDSADPEGGLGYLNNETKASAQALPNANPPGFTQAIRSTDNTTRRIAPGKRFPLSIGRWSGGGNRRYFLFEAAARGTGDLVLLLLQNGRIAVESAPIHFELLDIKEMYSRVQATPANNLQKPYTFRTTQPPRVETGIAKALPEFAYRPDPFGTPVTVTFVHGWNMYFHDYISFSETMYKRLWHAGFRGEFCAFRWPTDALITPEVLDREFFESYNISEHRALNFGPSLKQCIESIQQSHKKPIICHSLGGMVVTSALFNHMKTPTVVFMQAAASVGIFDTREALNERSLETAEFKAPIGLKTPDNFLTQSGYRGYLIAPGARVISYHNADDFALQTGSYVRNTLNVHWIANQAQSKPMLPFNNSGYGYTWFSGLQNGTPISRSYLGFRANGLRPTRLVIEDNEILAFVARSRTRALGAEPNVQGPFQLIDLHNLSSDGFTSSRPDHSGQFNRTISGTSTLFISILKDID